METIAEDVVEEEEEEGFLGAVVAEDGEGREGEGEAVGLASCSLTTTTLILRSMCEGTVRIFPIFVRLRDLLRFLFV